MTSARNAAADRGAVRAYYGSGGRGGELPGVLAAMVKDYAPTLGEPAVRAQLQRCQRDLADVPSASLPEMLYRLARQRLADLADRTPVTHGGRS